MVPTCNLLCRTTLYPAAAHTIKDAKQNSPFGLLDNEAIFPTKPGLQECVIVAMGGSAAIWLSH
jgi:hypothetical protein